MNNIIKNIKYKIKMKTTLKYINNKKISMNLYSNIMFLLLNNNKNMDLQKRSNRIRKKNILKIAFIIRSNVFSYFNLVGTVVREKKSQMYVGSTCISSYLSGNSIKLYVENNSLYNKFI